MDEEFAPHYEPADALQAPRYTGIRTFARCPYVSDLSGLDAAAIGIPFDTATSNRPGARFGPEAIRAASIALRSWNHELGVDVFKSLSVGDLGDIGITPGNARKTAGQIASALVPVLEAGISPVALGGDHSMVLGELRAYAEVHGPVALVLLDAHADVWDSYYGERYFHGTPFRRALEEGLLLPESSVLAGMRGGLYSANDLDEPRRMGFEVLTCNELRTLRPQEYANRVRERVGSAPVFFSFDIDVIDPAFAPATGTPEVAGLLPHEALAFIRSLAGIPFVGFDIVEVAPIYDGPGQITALLAANVAWEFLSLRALAQQSR